MSHSLSWCGPLHKVSRKAPLHQKFRGITVFTKLLGSRVEVTLPQHSKWHEARMRQSWSPHTSQHAPQPWILFTSPPSVPYLIASPGSYLPPLIYFPLIFFFSTLPTAHIWKKKRRIPLGLMQSNSTLFSEVWVSTLATTSKLHHLI